MRAHVERRKLRPVLVERAVVVVWELAALLVTKAKLRGARTGELWSAGSCIDELTCLAISLMSAMVCADLAVCLRTK